MRQTDGWKDGRTDGWMEGGTNGLTDRHKTKLIVAFRNFAKAPKKKLSGQNAVFLNITASSTHDYVCYKG